MRITMKTLLLLAAAMFCMAHLAQAQAQPSGKGDADSRCGPPPFMMPGVSPEKCKIVDKIIDESQVKLFPLMQQQKVLQAKLEALVVDAASDDAAITALVEEISKVRTAMAKIKIEVRRKALKETGVILPPGPPRGGPGPMMGPPGLPG